jgi:hypothetical protein
VFPVNGGVGTKLKKKFKPPKRNRKAKRALGI